MAYYQAQRTLLDLVNCIELPYGCYVKTDCIKWVKRFGPNLRPLAPGEQPKPTFLLKEVTNTVEDKVKEDVVVEPTPEVVEPTPEVVEPTPEVVEPTPEVVEVKTEPTLAESSKKVPKRRKLSV